MKVHLQPTVHAEKLRVVLQEVRVEGAADRFRLIKGQVHLQLQALPAPQVHLIGQPAVLAEKPTRQCLAGNCGLLSCDSRVRIAIPCPRAMDWV